MSRVCRRNLIAAVLLSAAAGLSLVQAASAAEIYKWVDENGTTHYSNVKPEGVKVDLVPEDNISVIPGSRIGAEAARAAERESQTSGAASESDVLTHAEALAEARMQQRRERMLQYCQRNNGVDCEREVDTELRAEGLMQGHRIVPPPVRVIPAPPATGESPGTPGSRLR